MQYIASRSREHKMILFATIIIGVGSVFDATEITSDERPTFVKKIFNKMITNNYMEAVKFTVGYRWHSMIRVFRKEAVQCCRCGNEEEPMCLIWTMCSIEQHPFVVATQVID